MVFEEDDIGKRVYEWRYGRRTVNQSKRVMEIKMLVTVARLGSRCLVWVLELRIEKMGRRKWFGLRANHITSFKEVVRETCPTGRALGFGLDDDGRW